MWRDLVLAVRILRRSPLFTSVAVLSLALGIGANTAIFSLVDQVILRLLPVKDPRQLVILHRTYNPNGSSTSDNFESVHSYAMYRELRDHDRGFSSVFARSGAGVTVWYRGSAESAAAEMVSGNFFQALGVGAAAGRTLTPDDDTAPGAHPVVVLSHSYWSSRFGRNPGIVNQTVRVNGAPMTVIGVVAAGFNGIFSGRTPDLYTPLTMQKAIRPTWNALYNAQFYWLSILARIAPDLTIQQAQAATDVAHRAVLEDELARGLLKASGSVKDQMLNGRLELRPAAQGINSLRKDDGAALIALMAMVGLVLLIACANVAGLMIARAAARQREMGIRLAIGATRWKLMRQLLTEGLILAAAAWALGLAVARWSIAALLRLLPSNFAGDWLTAGLNWRLLGFALLASFATGLIFALAPAWQSAKPGVANALRAGGSMASTPGAVWFRKCAVVLQVALSLLLVTAAGLFAGTLRNLTKVSLGFRVERLLTFKVDASRGRPALADSVAFYDELELRLKRIPGVLAVGAANGGPFSNSSYGGNITIQGYRAKNNDDANTQMIAVSPGFFAALGIPLRAGREFTDRDRAGAPKAVVVNESFAKLYCDGQSPIGRRLMFGASSHPALDREIVGMVADFHVDVKGEPRRTLYYPYSQWKDPEALMFYVRGSGDVSALGAAIRAAVRAQDAEVPVTDLQPISLRIDDSLYVERLLAALSVAFGLLATLLSALGLYGIVAYTVARRTAEIGVRMALGALPGGVLRMVLLEAGRLALAGITLGVGASLVLSPLVKSQLFGLKAADPRILGGAAVLLATVALGAAMAPGRRASRVDPVAALKYE
jgi:predicted permease